jgi:hypothetical protein
MRSTESMRCSKTAALLRGVGLGASCSWALLGLGAGCMRTVVLGSECPELDDSCLEPMSQPAAAEDGSVPPGDGDGADTVHGDDTGPPVSSLDAGEPEQTSDAELPSEASDAQADAAPTLVALAVDNPSFERGGGLPGDVLLVSLVETLLPLPPVTWAWTTLPNWYACVPLSVSSESREPSEAAGSPAGKDYVSFVPNGTTVRQALATPMTKGSRYFFALDTISRSEGTQNLFVEVRGARQQCGEGIVLGRSDLLPEASTWTSTCVSFTASDRFTHLLIGPGWEGAAPGVGARLMIDNLRQVDRCPP